MARKTNAKKSKYTKGQQIAYHSGRGFAVAYKRKGINFKKPENRQSFHEGYMAAIRNMEKYPNKYTDLKK